MAIEEPGWFQFPNEVLEKHQALSDAAFRVFAAICRKTIGWHKTSDAVSYSQLTQITGKSRPTVIKAIEDLLTADLIEREMTIGKTNKYTVKLLTSKDFLLDQSNILTSPSKESLPTKETLKETIKINNTSSNSDNGIGKEAKICLDYYFQKHVAPLPEGRGFKPTISGQRDMEIFKKLLGNYDVAAVKETLDTFFVESWFSNGKTFRRSNFSTRAFFNSFDTLYGVNKAKAEGRR